MITLTNDNEKLKDALIAAKADMAGTSLAQVELHPLALAQLTGDTAFINRHLAEVLPPETSEAEKARYLKLVVKPLAI